MIGYTHIFAILTFLIHWNSFCYTLGVENITDFFLQKITPENNKNYRVALVSNQTSIDQHGNRTVDILLSHGLRVLYILAPEHGFEGTVPAGKPVGFCTDQKTSIPIESIYGTGGDVTISGKYINQSILDQVDVIFFDLQDSGMRHYTYISTLLCVLEGAAARGKVCVVLDRPNPLGGIMEGPLVDPEFKSFISIAPIPLRHGMTIGEIATFFNKYVLKKPAQLHVLKMKEYDRRPMQNILKPLSPNLPTIKSCYGYSFLGILGEIEPFDVGVGTAHPFQLILLPETCHFPQYEWVKFRMMLANNGIQTANYSYFNAKKQKNFTGVQLKIEDMLDISSFQVLLEILDFFKNFHIPFLFSKTFNKAMGTDLVQKLCMKGCTRWTLRQKVNTDLMSFYTKAKRCFLYEPYPTIQKI